MQNITQFQKQGRYIYYSVLIVKLKVGRIKRVNSDVSIFAATCVAIAIRVKLNAVYGPEMALDTAELFFKY